MKVQVVSDIHAEFYSRTPDGLTKLINDMSDCDSDILVMAGDLFVNNLYYDKNILPRNKPYICIPGNHEYYHGRVSWFGKVQDRFITTTGWADGSGGPLFNVEQINDFNLIDGLYRASDMVPLGRRSRDFIEKHLKEIGEDAIVVTHNAPSPKSISKEYEGSYLNTLFANNWEWLIEKYQPKLWIHGHVHQSFDYYIGKTRVICNPAGYPRKGGTLENKNFDPKLTVEIM